jgi:hypothetical protein
VASHPSNRVWSAAVLSSVIDKISTLSHLVNQAVVEGAQDLAVKIVYPERLG